MYKKIFKNTWLKVFPLVLFFGIYSNIFAIGVTPPSGGYLPGTELDPDCIPGDNDCIVNNEGVSVDTDLASVFTGTLGSPSQMHSVFLGYQAGYNTDFSGGGGDVGSNFLGYQSGYDASYSTDANFLGTYAGMGATTAPKSNFIGYSAGNNASVANDSNFIGTEAGINAFNASYSNFIGYNAGNHANLAPYSNFIGYNSGLNAYEADNSNFLGSFSGYESDLASNSIFIGTQSGYQDTVDNTNNLDDFSILVGPITSTGGYSNSIAIGGYATNTATNQMMVGSTTRPVNTLVVKGATSTCTIDTAGGALSCTSDERLKTNITDLDTNVLEKLFKIRTVNYNWLNGNSDKKNIGFLAQDLEQYFPELVSTDPEGYKSVYYANMAPVLVEAIRELNLKLEGVDVENGGSKGSLISWFGDIANNISEFVAGTIRAKDKICIGEGSDEVCVTKEDLLKMKENLSKDNEPVIEEEVSEEPKSEESVIEEEVSGETKISEENTQVITEEFTE